MFGKRIKNIYKNNNMFIKLQASFILIILTIAVFGIINNNIYKKNIESELVNVSKNEILSLSIQLDNYFENVTNKVFLNFYNDYKNIITHSKISSYNLKIIYDELSSLLSFNEYISSNVLIMNNSEYILTNEGSFLKHDYFNKFFINPAYNQTFWEKEMEEEYLIKFYPTDTFNKYISPNNSMNQFLLPMAFKTKINSEYILISFIDIKKLLSDLGQDYNFSFCISNNYGILFSDSEDIPFDLISESLNLSSSHGSNDGYVISFKSKLSDLIYSGRISRVYLNEQLRKYNIVNNVILLFSIVMSAIISSILVKYFNDPVKQIAHLVNEADYGTNMRNLENSISLIVENNAIYEKTLSSRNSVLKELFYHAAIKDSYISDDKAVSEVFKNLIRSPNHAIIYFKVHYRKFKDSFSNQNDYLFSIIVNLIKKYVSNEYAENTTFPVGGRAIVSIVNIPPKISDIENTIRRISEKLSSENEYFYFTIVYSEIKSNISQLNDTFSKLTKISEYRQLAESTQIIFENDSFDSMNNYSFPSQIREQLALLLINAKEKECYEIADEAIIYNEKKNISKKAMTSLCEEIQRCLENDVRNTYNEVPKSINVNPFAECDSVKDFEAACHEIIRSYISFVLEKSTSQDYIIDYAKQHLQAHYSEDISFEEIANNLKITRSYLSTYFKKNTGVNISYYLNDLRINKACELLTSTQLAIKNIGELVGIPNTNTFIRLFNKLKGKTPNNYRREYSNVS